MKTNNKVSAYILRGSMTALLLSCVIVALCSAIHVPEQGQKALRPHDNAIFGANVHQNRTLSFAERIAYQWAIEDVYWRHRVWPDTNAGPKPTLANVISQAQLEKKVEEYLRNSQALEDYWQRPITAEQLQAEMERMAQHTRQPEVLRELFEVLGNDPFVIAECLARSALAERLVTSWYAYDQRFHGELREQAAADLRAHPNVAEMKQLSGRYSEIEMVRSDTAQRAANPDSGRIVKLDSREWDQTVQKLVWTFGNSHSLAAGMSAAGITQIKTGALSCLQEDETCYYVTAVLSKAEGSLKLATVSWLKEPLETWRAGAENVRPNTIPVPNGKYQLPGISEGGGCIDDTWTATPGPPDGRVSHTAVWTGSEMIIWGGNTGGGGLDTGARYNPATDIWTATSLINVPTARSGHTAVWTGSEMIIWGGSGGGNKFNGGELNTGAKYNPMTDSWTAMSTANAPDGRVSHTAVWTGNEMIVWGGSFYQRPQTHYLNTGGRYNPNTDSWTATTTNNAPDARDSHTAVLLGNEMVVWGGSNGASELNTGGRYNPGTDSWTATSLINAPSARYLHTAVSTGSEMIIWGGNAGGGELDTGARYNPATDIWTATSLINVPTARSLHTAVWTGDEMIVWGGGVSGGTLFNTGARYNPGTDSWTATTTTTNAPSQREQHTAVWTGTEMIVWGGFDGNLPSTGGRYNPGADNWTTTNTSNAPAGRGEHTAVWTGTEMLIWGGSDARYNYLNTGATYNAGTDSWTATNTTNAPDGRTGHTAVWTGNEMIIWGGYPYTSSGGRYNPGTDSWIATSMTNVPHRRESHTAVWTGIEMIVWGGMEVNIPYFNTGGRYNPITDSWTATTTTNAPDGRASQTAVWTGSEMVVWGGLGTSGPSFNTGGRYNPGSDSWTATSLNNVPEGRQDHTAVWTGGEMIVWGGDVVNDGFLNTGGRYEPGIDSWTATSIISAPSQRSFHTAVWTGREMIVWGGEVEGNVGNTGGRYNPDTDSWTATNIIRAPSERAFHTAVWTGDEMIVWGGYPNLSTGGRYCAQGGPTPTPTPSPTPTPTATPTPTPTPCMERCTPTPRPRPTPAPRP